MHTTESNPHAGRPFTDDDDAIERARRREHPGAAVLAGPHHRRPSSICGDAAPCIGLNEYQGSMTEDEGRGPPSGAPCDRRVPRRRMRPPTAARRGGPRDDGVPRVRAGAEDVARCSSRICTSTVRRRRDQMGRRDLRRSARGHARRRDRVRRIRPARGHPPLAAGIPFTIVEKSGGPGGTWWDNRYPGARVDIGSHSYCYSFEPADHWTEILAAGRAAGTSTASCTSTASRSTAGSTRGRVGDLRRRDRPWSVTVTNPTAEDHLERSR